MIKQEIDARLVGPDRFILNSPVVYFDNDRPARTLTAPAGFFTDFLSIPLIGSVFISRTGRSAAAGVIHDALYSGQAVLSDEMRRRYPSGCTRRDADALLRVMARELGESWATSTALYVSVRAAGWYRWNQYRAHRG